MNNKSKDLIKSLRTFSQGRGFQIGVVALMFIVAGLTTAYAMHPGLRESEEVNSKQSNSELINYESDSPEEMEKAEEESNEENNDSQDSDSEEEKTPPSQPEQNLEKTEQPAEVDQDSTSDEKPKEDNTTDKEEETKEWWEYPDNIQTTTKSGDNLLVLVNKKYQLPSTYAPSDLVELNTVNNLNIRLTKTLFVRDDITQNLKELGAAAENEGLDMSIISAYRSYSTQEATYQYWLDYNGGDVSATDKVSARPGHSQHQLGTTVDFSSSEVNDQIGSVFNPTEAAAWLENNAWKYGFVLAYPEGKHEITGYSYESWHYRYIGVGNAENFHNSDITLDEWLQQI
jgi:D-alanyl-D-alanine carboxypeptidase